MFRLVLVPFLVRVGWLGQAGAHGTPRGATAVRRRAVSFGAHRVCTQPQIVEGYWSTYCISILPKAMTSAHGLFFNIKKMQKNKQH